VVPLLTWGQQKIQLQTLLTMLKRLANHISKTNYVQTAIKERAGLAAFKQKPTKRIVIGLIIIGISYTIGWPFVGALGILSAYFGEPLILAIGGPITYGLSHLVFILGAYLAGAEHSKIFFRWATRVIIEKLMGHSLAVSPGIENNCPPESRG
jgi:hypothetical protein